MIVSLVTRSKICKCHDETPSEIDETLALAERQSARRTALLCRMMPKAREGHAGESFLVKAKEVKELND